MVSPTLAPAASVIISQTFREAHAFKIALIAFGAIGGRSQDKTADVGLIVREAFGLF
jgi:hypothetical protein